MVKTSTLLDLELALFELASTMNIYFCEESFTSPGLIDSKNERRTKEMKFLTRIRCDNCAWSNLKP